MVSINEPRYRDRKVLVARYKIPCGQGVRIEILRGAYKGVYEISNETICSSPIETINSRLGKAIQMRAVSLDELRRVQ